MIDSMQDIVRELCAAFLRLISLDGLVARTERTIDSSTFALHARLALDLFVASC